MDDGGFFKKLKTATCRFRTCDGYALHSSSLRRAAGNASASSCISRTERPRLNTATETLCRWSFFFSSGVSPAKMKCASRDPSSPRSDLKWLLLAPAGAQRQYLCFCTSKASKTSKPEEPPEEVPACGFAASAFASVFVLLYQ